MKKNILIMTLFLGFCLSGCNSMKTETKQLQTKMEDTTAPIDVADTSDL